MKELDLLLDKLRRDSVEADATDFAPFPISDDSVSNSDNDTNRTSFGSNEGVKNNSSQTIYISKMVSKCQIHGLKPYSQLSEREKQRLMERKTRRLVARRFGINRSISIGNEDLVKLNDNGFVRHRRRENSTCSAGSLDSNEDLSSSFEEEEDLEKSLESWYQAGCGEDLDQDNDRTNWDLVKSYMEIEDKVEEAKKQLMDLRLSGSVATTNRTFNVEEEMEKIRVFRKEIENLVKENKGLLAENEKLRLQLSPKTG